MADFKISNTSAHKNDFKKPDQPKSTHLMVPPSREQVSPPPSPSFLPSDHAGELVLVVAGEGRRRLTTDELNKFWPLGARKVVPSEEKN